LSAKRIQHAIARGRLKVLTPSATLRDPLSNEVGNGLSALLRAAKTLNGVVICPSPVKRLGLEDERDADLSAYRDVLTDMHALLTTFVERGAVEQAVEQVARSYFEVQDKGWQPTAPLDPRKPIFIDGLALIYLQTVDLLDPVLNLFSEVYVDATVAEEAQALIDYENHTNTVLELIGDIRAAVHSAHVSGKLVFGPMRNASANDDEAGPPPPR
jgi:hypothetical protein